MPSAEFYKRHKEATKQAAMQYARAHPEKVRNWGLKTRYGITSKDYEKLLNKQKGKCLICGEKKNLVVDHSHKTNKVRGLLCKVCNTHLGWYENHERQINKVIATGKE